MAGFLFGGSRRGNRIAPVAARLWGISREMRQQGPGTDERLGYGYCQERVSSAAVPITSEVSPRHSGGQGMA